MESSTKPKACLCMNAVEYMSKFRIGVSKNSLPYWLLNMKGLGH